MSGGYISQKIEDEVLCFGIAFYKKRCIVKKNRVLEVPRLLAVIKTDDWGTFFLKVRPAAHVSSGCKSRIRPVVGRI